MGNNNIAAIAGAGERPCRPVNTCFWRDYHAKLSSSATSRGGRMSEDEFGGTNPVAGGLNPSFSVVAQQKGYKLVTDGSLLRLSGTGRGSNT